MTEQNDVKRTHSKKPLFRAPDSNIIAVASGKGGVGKTWFSSTLAYALAQKGKRVLLFDGDLGLANVDIQLGVMVKRDLKDVIEGTLSLERVIHHFKDGGFDVIAGRSGQATLSSLPLLRLNEIMKQLRSLAKKYDAVIIDLGAGVDKTVRFMAAMASLTLLVTTEEPTSLTDAYAFIKLSHSTGHSDTIKLVINMASSQRDGERTYKTLAKASSTFLKITPDLVGILPLDRQVRESIRTQTPFLMRYPTSESAEIFDKISQNVLETIKS